MIVRPVLLLALLLSALWPGKAQALSPQQVTGIVGENVSKRGFKTADHNGISLIALNPPAGEAFDVPIVKPESALKVISEALSLIESTSLFGKKQIERLKKRGQVTIVYDPSYPDKLANMSSVQVALFSPHYFKPLTPKSFHQTFLVIVSRHGVKWPLQELAAVMVHELVGHGVQHLNNRWGQMRKIDMECEAWLYEEMAYQNFKMDKFSNQMIDFKKQLAGQCDSFLRYLRNNDPKGAAVWDNLNPDVPKLLTHFAGYMRSLKKN